MARLMVGISRQGQAARDICRSHAIITAARNRARSDTDTDRTAIMIDIKILRDDPDGVAANCERRGIDVDVPALHAMDQQVRELIQQVEDMRARRNALTKECKDNPDARVQVRELKTTIAEGEEQLKQLRAELQKGLDWLPNFLCDSVPDGAGDHDNVELKTWGEPPQADFELRDHQALGEILDIIDTTRGGKVAQSGFFFWKGKGAQLAAALFYWTQQTLVGRGFTLFFSPCAAKERTLYGTGYLPFFADQTYQLEGDDLALIGTSEQTLVGYHTDETLETLPLRYTAFTPCFRTEAGSYGKETRGIFRVHQFHKVEQIIFCRPEDSVAHHEECLVNEEYLLQQLGIPYRVVNVCVGDLGAPGYKKYDTEALFPGYGGYREVCSNTNLTDFQSRRLGVRYVDDEGKRDFVHTISATAVTDRVVCAILENGQEADGSVRIPEVLQPLTGFARIEPA
jgi:seryl-tRNA synthetase